MTNNLELKQTFELLNRTVDTFGPDAARWPAGTRVRLSAFVAANADARRLIAEARALDKVLSAAPCFTAGQHVALVEKIVARAERAPRIAAESPPVVQSQFTRMRRHAMAAAALAASLMIGVVSGQNTTVGSLSAAWVNGSDTGTSAGQQFALGEDTDSLLEEDLL